MANIGLQASAPLHLQHAELIRDGAFIGGIWRARGDDPCFAVTDPACGAAIRAISDGGAEAARAALDSAHAAFAGWRQRTAADRAQWLRRWHAQIQAHAEDLARLISLEQGKPLHESRSEIAYGAAYVEWFAEEARRIYGELIPAPVPGRQLLVQREPVGVVAAITPWNFPFAMLARKLAPALAAGCTVVAKPSEHTPLSALALAYLAQQAGLPAGVINVVPASRRRAAEVVDVWLDDARVRKLSFTGSTAVGKHLARRSADTLKRVSLELGGNAPLIVFDDADLDLAVTAAIGAKFRNAGQTCISANRLLIQAGCYEDFSERFAAAARKLLPAPASTLRGDLGPLIDDAAIARVRRHVDDALTRGARLLSGGDVAAAGSLFFAPTVLAEVSNDMLVTQEECFGPVAPLIRFAEEAECVRMANAVSSGLCAYLFSEDLRRAWRVAAALQVGMVGINEAAISTEVAPFGGVKDSGYGREGSRHGLDDYLQLKYLAVGAMGVGG